ncbi:GtrA family protein [Glycomyces sp. TRM65418]|uniref:GtrA family protein n=1 Tax=Glycomyces sp. TRM65418 TaxID=2867006 RepID=UPI001CE67158|nr:GtrA family protein [Glycomyces sp. TRM65418]MCC3762931.1 GtrA family protein [Glycomyces sp. TRM65418]QZD56955.1 GtrA family protein [Glycomyces sp. TRM65418]
MPTSIDTPTPPPARSGLGGLFARGLDLLKRHAAELIRFAGVGGTAYIIDVGLFNLLYLGMDWSYWYAKIISTLVAMTVAFAGNRHWTWRERRGSAAAHRQYALYFLFNGIGLLISLACLWANSGLAQVWPQYFDNELAVNIAANFFGVGFATIFRFFAYRTWVFRKPKLAEVLN